MNQETGFRELGRRECLALLANESIGRVIYTHGALPAVLPVRFSLDRDSSVVLRTSVASRLAGAVEGSVVAFETDRFDEAAGTGWSVTVTGRATQVTESGARARLNGTGTGPWMPLKDETLIRIVPELVTGSMLARPPAAAEEDGTGRGHPSLAPGP